MAAVASSSVPLSGDFSVSTASSRSSWRRLSAVRGRHRDVLAPLGGHRWYQLPRWDVPGPSRTGICDPWSIDDPGLSRSPGRRYRNSCPRLGYDEDHPRPRLFLRRCDARVWLDNPLWYRVRRGRVLPGADSIRHVVAAIPRAIRAGRTTQLGIFKFGYVTKIVSVLPGASVLRDRDRESQTADSEPRRDGTN